MEFEIIEKSGFKVMGVSVWTLNKDGIATDDIFQLWQRWFKEEIMDQIPGKINDDIYNVYCEYETDSEGSYKVILGNRVNSIDYVPPGLEGISIPKSKYALYHLEGKLPDVVYNTWQRIHHEKSYERRFSADFDVYNPNSYDPLKARVDIFVSIK